MQLKADAYALAYDAFRRALALNSRNADALARPVGCRGGCAQAGRGARCPQGDRRPRARQRAGPRRAVPRPAPRRAISTGALRWRPRRCAWRPTIRAPASSWRRSSPTPAMRDRLATLAESLATRFPDRPEPQYYRASALFLSGRTEDAIAAVRHVTDSSPGSRARPESARRRLRDAGPARLRAGGVRSVAAGEPARSVDLRQPRAVLAASRRIRRRPRGISPRRSRSIRRSSAARDGLAQARSLLAGR